MTAPNPLFTRRVRMLADALRWVHEALYLRDPDCNGVGSNWDRPQEEWPYMPDGVLAMSAKRLDLKDLLNEIR